MRILMIDDDIKMSSFIKMGLGDNDFFMDVAYDTASGEKMLSQKKYDVILLDVMLPGTNGFDFCKKSGQAILIPLF